MEIVDINFNYELFEENIKEKRSKCDEVCDKLQNLFYLSDELDNFDSETNFYTQIEDAISEEMMETVENLVKASKELENAINMYIAVMKARINYVETTKTEDQILSDYKTRTERTGLRTSIVKYEKLKADYQKSVKGLLDEVEIIGPEDEEKSEPEL